MKLKKLFIVIEETAGPSTVDENGRDSKPFRLYLDGDIERLLDKSIKSDDLSAAEFWGSRLFQIVISVMNQTGAVVDSYKKSEVN